MPCRMDIRLGDGQWPELLDKMKEGKVIHVAENGVIGVGGLAGGMTSGKPSVVLVIHLPDGRSVMAETSLRLFLMAADALRARFGSGGD